MLLLVLYAQLCAVELVEILIPRFHLPRGGRDRMNPCYEQARLSPGLLRASLRRSNLN